MDDPDDKWQTALSYWFFPCAALFLIFGIIWLKVPISTTVFLIIGTIMGFVPLLFLSFYLPMLINKFDTANPDAIIVAVFTLFIFIYWCLVRFSRDCCLQASKSQFFAELCVALYCLFLWLIIFILIVTGVFFPQSESSYAT